MLRLKKLLLIAGMLGGALLGTFTLGTSSAQAGGYGYGYFGHYHVYTPIYRVHTYRIAPVYHHHCVPTYFGY